MQLHPNFPLLGDPSNPENQIWADPIQEKYVNQMEKTIHKSQTVKEQRDFLKKGRQVEGRITRFNLRTTDVFFNSKFELGNLKQAFIVPNESDFEAICEEKMVIPPEHPELVEEEAVEEEVLG